MRLNLKELLEMFLFMINKNLLEFQIIKEYGLMRNLKHIKMKQTINKINQLNKNNLIIFK